MILRSVRHDKIEIYVHFIWTVYDRRPLITPAIEDDLFPIIHQMGERHKVKTVALNGVADHIHWLTKYSSTTRTCDLVKDAKGASSAYANGVLGNFKWRPTYAAYSVSRWNMKLIVDYIQRQKEHHDAGSTHSNLESNDDGVGEIADGE